MECVTYLWIPVPETVALNVKGIASRLWPSVEQVALPLYAAKRAKMAVWAADAKILHPISGTISSAILDTILDVFCCVPELPLGEKYQVVQDLALEQAAPQVPSSRCLRCSSSSQAGHARTGRLVRHGQ